LVRFLYIEYIQSLVLILNIVIWNGTTAPQNGSLSETGYTLLFLFAPPTLFCTQTGLFGIHKLIAHLFLNIVKHTVVLHRVVNIFEIINSILFDLGLFEETGCNTFVPEIVLHWVVHFIWVGLEMLPNYNTIVVFIFILSFWFTCAHTLSLCIFTKSTEWVCHTVVVFHYIRVSTGIQGDRVS